MASWLAIDLVNKIDLLNPFLLLTVYPAHPLHLAVRISVNFRPPRLDWLCVMFNRLDVWLMYLMYIQLIHRATPYLVLSAIQHISIFYIYRVLTAPAI